MPTTDREKLRDKQRRYRSSEKGKAARREQERRARLRKGIQPRVLLTPEERLRRKRDRRTKYKRRKRAEKRALRGPKPAPIENDPLYHRYRSAKERCNNPNNKDWKSYGALGIEFRFNSFAEYKAEVEKLGPRPSLQHTIDRRNDYGHYEAENLRWASHSEQVRNRRPQSEWLKNLPLDPRSLRRKTV